MSKFLAKGIALAVAIAVLNAAPAKAALVKWTFEDTYYNDLSPNITGSFRYDADTNTYSGVNITSYAGRPPFASGLYYPGPYINYTGVSAGNNTSFRTNRFTIVRGGMYIPDIHFQLWLFFNSPLTNAGGTVAMDDMYSGETCTFQDRCIDAIRFASGNVVGTPIPFKFESTLGLIALGGMFGGYTYFKKKRNTIKQPATKS
jgi:hypothetical protein